MLSQGNRVVVDTWAQGRMVDKVRIQAVGHRNWVARNGSRAVVDTWAGVRSIYLPGQNRRDNLGALPGVPTAGFHASRFALASRNLETCGFQIALLFPFAILPLFATFVNSICVHIADCNKIVIANSIGSGYNDCRLQ